MRGTRPEGFSEFVVARGPALHRTAVLLTGEQQDAEDLVQSALAKAWQTWGRFDANHEAYVRRIIVREFVSSGGRREEDRPPTPARQRAAVILRFFDDYGQTAAAEVLSVSIGTVESDAFTALASCRSPRHSCVKSSRRRPMSRHTPTSMR